MLGRLAKWLSKQRGRYCCNLVHHMQSLQCKAWRVGRQKLLYSSQQAAAAGCSWALTTDACSAVVLAVQLRTCHYISTCVPHDNFNNTSAADMMRKIKLGALTMRLSDIF